MSIPVLLARVGVNSHSFVCWQTNKHACGSPVLRCFLLLEESTWNKGKTFSFVAKENV